MQASMIGCARDASLEMLFFFFLLPFSSFVSLSQNKVKVKIIIDNILRKVLTHLKTERLAVASMVGVI